MFMAAYGAVVERYIFAFLIKLKLGHTGKALGKAGLSGELMRKLVSFQHCHCVYAGSLRKSGIEGQRTDAGFLARLIGQLKHFLFDLRFSLDKRDIGGFGRSGLECRPVSCRTAAGPIGRGRHQPERRMDGQDAGSEQKGKHKSGGSMHSFGLPGPWEGSI